MAKKILTARGFWEEGTVIIRVIAGIIIFQFGLQLFDNEGMKGYTGWLTDLGFPMPDTMASLGKWAELIGGASLILGFLTRWLMIPLIITMAVIIFIMGQADPFGDDQQAFLLMLVFIYYCLAGPGKWSLDYFLFDRKQILNAQKVIYADPDPLSR